MSEERARYDPGGIQQWVRAMAGGDREQRDSRVSSKDWRTIAVLVERIQVDLNTLTDTVLAKLRADDDGNAYRRCPDRPVLTPIDEIEVARVRRGEINETYAKTSDGRTVRFSSVGDGDVLCEWVTDE